VVASLVRAQRLEQKANLPKADNALLL